MTTTQTAGDLIRQSIAQDEIVHSDYTDTLAGDLAAECDDSTDTEAGTEYWGADETGQTWRVTLDRGGITEA